MQIYTLFFYLLNIFEINSESLTIFIKKTAKKHRKWDALGSYYALMSLIRTWPS